MLPLAHSQVNSKADCPGVKRMGGCRVVQETLVEMQDVWKIGRMLQSGLACVGHTRLGKGGRLQGSTFFHCAPLRQTLNEFLAPHPLNPSSPLWDAGAHSRPHLGFWSRATWVSGLARVGLSLSTQDSHPLTPASSSSIPFPNTQGD